MMKTTTSKTTYHFFIDKATGEPVVFLYDEVLQECYEGFQNYSLPSLTQAAFWFSVMNTTTTPTTTTTTSATTEATAKHIKQKAVPPETEAEA